jgi:hypothetical protein
VTDEQGWCSCDDWRRNREFCERHQAIWCIACDGRCPECRGEAALGEPDDEDDDDDDW